MKDRDYVKLAIKESKKSKAIDGRDYARLFVYFTKEEIQEMGYSFKEYYEDIQEWNRENILKELEEDLEFAFEKALNKRGISASCMYEVIKMWMWVLDDDLRHFSDYAQYGLPLLKAVAVKFSLPNPIGDDEGDEFEYSSEAE